MLFTILIATSCLLWTGCSNNNEDGSGSAEITLDKTEVSVSMSEPAKVQITTDAEGTWNARTTSAWLKLSPSSGVGPGTLTITCVDPGYREVNSEPVYVYLAGKRSNIT